MTDNNLTLFLFTALTPILYLLIVIKSLKIKSISTSSMIKGLAIGVFSITIMETIKFVFPNYITPWFKDVYLNLIVLSFIQVALIEELAKLATYKISRINTTVALPLAIMIYCMLPAASFSVLENMKFIKNLPDNSWEVALKRSITAVPLHLFCGAIMGYFIALGHWAKQKSNNVVNRLINKSKHVRMALYASAGVFFATLLHGVYDLNFFAAAFAKTHNLTDAGKFCTSILLMCLIFFILLVKRLKKLTPQ